MASLIETEQNQAINTLTQLNKSISQNGNPDQIISVRKDIRVCL
jgi:hypothetical protein